MQILNTQQPVKLFFYDCEVDDKDISKVNITEVCLACEEGQDTFVGYMKAPPQANYTTCFKKPIPKDKSRYTTKNVLTSLFHFQQAHCLEQEIPVFIGYNVKAWDQPVLYHNCQRYSVAIPDLLRFFDISLVAQALGFPLGTTQFHLERAWNIPHDELPANRHRAYADVRVVQAIWRRMQEALDEEGIRQQAWSCFLQEDGEQMFASLLQQKSPFLQPCAGTLQVIQQQKAREKRVSKEIVVIYDLETTGLFQEMDPELVSHHNTARRITEIGMKILSFPGTETFRSFVNPGVPIPEQASIVTGISTENVKDAPSFATAWSSLQSWLKSSQAYHHFLQENNGQEPGIIFVGHNNVAYDNVLLTQELLRTGVDFKRELDKKVHRTWDSIHFIRSFFAKCTVKPLSYRLQDLGDFFHITCSSQHQAHRALDDVETLEKVLQAIFEPFQLASVLSLAAGLQKPGVSTKELLLQAKTILSQGSSTHEEALQQAFTLAEEVYSPQAKDERKRKEVTEKMPSLECFLVQQAPLASLGESFVCL